MSSSTRQSPSLFLTLCGPVGCCCCPESPKRQAESVRAEESYEVLQDKKAEIIEKTKGFIRVATTVGLPITYVGSRGAPVKATMRIDKNINAVTLVAVDEVEEAVIVPFAACHRIPRRLAPSELGEHCLRLRIRDTVIGPPGAHQDELLLVFEDEDARSTFWMSFQILHTLSERRAHHPF